MALQRNSSPLVDHFAQQLAQGKHYRSIVQARSEAAQIWQQPVQPGTPLAKQVDEAVEAGLVRAAQQLIQGLSPDEAFDALVNLYERQPNLSTRSSTSIKEQAYSTPVPIAYLASQLAGIDETTTVYEPSAGHGALLLGANPALVQANEINPERAADLQQRGYRVTQGDAMAETLAPRSVDVVVSNPPFGTVKDAAGQSQQWQVGGGAATRDYSTTQIDHAIALQSLQAMKDDGRAVLILGAPLSNKTGNREAAAKTYNSKQNRPFYASLYRNYNVVEHFCVSGDLYKRQGTTFPVDVVVIEGRGASQLPLPAAEPPPVYDSFEQLKERWPDGLSRPSLLLDSPDPTLFDRAPGRTALDDASARDRPGLVSRLSERQSELADPVGGEPDRSLRDDLRLFEHRTVYQPAPTRTLSQDRAVGTESDLRQRPPTGLSPDPVLPSLSPPDSTHASGPARNPRRPNPGGMAQLDERPRPLVTSSAGQPLGSPSPQPMPNDSQSKPKDPTQVPYQPRSSARGFDTLVPANMQSAVTDALDNLEQRVGNLDDYVARQLNIDSTAQLHGRFGAEQVDALALAFSNLEQNQGFIIGDQTGVGKGRFVAAVIEHTRQQGLIPVFVTQDERLYADMFRDLEDIGVSDLSPLVTNNSLNIPLPNGDALKTKSAASHGRLIRTLADSGELGDNYDAVFTTYSQLQTLKGRDTPRREMLRQLAPNAVLILDESHNAGGTKQNNQNFGAAANRADFVRELIEESAGVVYSSATYAKNPYTMTLYAAKSGMGEVATGDELVEMVTEGGVPLQQMLASKLSEAGQYVRRERSYEGIEFGAAVAPMDKAMAENLATAMRLVMAFDDARSGSVKDIDKALRADAKQRGSDSSIGKAGASSTNFTSVMHNLIGQTLLSMKAEATVQEALKALEKGEKPVIALSNTMGSLIERTAKEQDLSPGDPIELSTANMLHRYLERSREIVIKDYDGQGNRHRLSDEQLGPMAVAAYEEALDFINESDWGENPASAIDYIRARLEQEGYTTGEITGRTHQIEYGADGEMTYQVRGAAETSSAGKVAVVSGFNSGEIDAVVINRSGSTGISLHASERFTDQKPRRMIVAQPDLNIDIFMQTLGRIHRTGQVEKPAFTLLMGDIPAEKRPAAVLMRKMASLNANTTAARGSSFDLSQITDFMNVYGDQVATELMAQRPDLHEMMGKPLGQLSEETDLEKLDIRDTVAKLTGRIPLLPLAQQEELYGLLEEGYNERLALEEAMGQSKLEAKTLDLDARTTARVEVMPGDGQSPFTQPVHLEIMDVKALRKPMTTLEVTNAVRAEVGLESVTTVDDHDPEAVKTQAQGQTQQALDQAIAQLPDYRKAYEAGVRQSKSYLKLDGEKRETLVEKKLATLDKKLTQQQAKLEGGLADFVPGQSVKLVNEKDGATYYGVVEQVSHKNSSAAANPINPSTWRLQIQMADSMRQIRVPVSKVNGGRDADGMRLIPQAQTSHSDQNIYQLFDERQSLAREERQVFTGNVIRAFSRYKGNLVNFSDSQGQVRQGLIMASGFDIMESLDKQPVAMPDAAKAMDYLKLKGQEGATRLKTQDENLTVHWNKGNLFINAARGKGTGGQYYLDEGLQETAKAEFVSSGEHMKLKVTDEAQALAVLDYMIEDGGWPLQAFEQRQLARDLLGIEMPGLERVDPVEAKPVSVVEPGQQQLDFEVVEPAVPAVKVEPAIVEPVVSAPAVVEVSPAVVEPAISQPVVEEQPVIPETKPALLRSLATPIASPAPAIETQPPVVEPALSPPPSVPLPITEAEEVSAPPLLVSPPPVPEKVEATPALDPQGLNSAQAYQLEQLAFEHPEPGTGAADLKEEIRDRLTMGGGTPAQVMAQMDQELDAKEDQPVAQAREPEVQPQAEGYSPTLQEMRDWLQDAKVNQRPANYLKRIRELSVEFLADTPMARQPVGQRDPEARNPKFVLSEAAQTAMERDRAASEQRRTPTRQMLLSWYSAARATEQGPDVLGRIQALGQAQVAGTTEGEKPAGDRSLGFRNPEFVLGRQDYWEAVQLTQLTQPSKHQQTVRHSELEHAA